MMKRTVSWAAGLALGLVCLTSLAPGRPEDPGPAAAPAAAKAAPSRIVRVTVYPDSDKIGVFVRDGSDDVVVRRGDAVGYYEGEARPPG